MSNARELIKSIVLSGTPEEKRVLFAFSIDDPDEKILKKYKLFARSNYPRYFKSPDAEEHDNTLLGYIQSYKGLNAIEIGFRGYGKTSLLKLFVAFVLLNDQSLHRKYIKILSKDGKNSKQIVTDVYNLIIEVADIYGSVFEKQDNKKREETMSSFTLSDGRKLSSGTVGQTQRGHIQDAYRPDWIWFEDLEDRDSVSSITITEGIIQKADEAITGLSFDGSYIVTANYISDVGVVQWFINKPSIKTHIVPIIDKEGNPAWAVRYNKEKIQELKDNAEDWAGEYLCDPTRVGDKFFDIDRIEYDLKNALTPIKQSAGVRYFAKDGRTLYLPHHRFGMGVDLSDGVGKDSCALSVFNYTTGELAASADDNHTAPDLFTYEAIRVGQEFGQCIIAPEVNNTCGGIAIATLKDKSYPNIYIREIDTKLHNVVTNEYGWKTTSKTKPQMFYDFRKDYNDGLIKIYDERVLKEMKSFTKADLKDASPGAVTRHFDLLTSVAIAWQMKDHAQQADSIKSFYNNLSQKRTVTGAVK